MTKKTIKTTFLAAIAHRCALRGNCFRSAVVSECSGHNLPAPFLRQDTALPNVLGCGCVFTTAQRHRFWRMRVHRSQPAKVAATSGPGSSLEHERRQS